MPKANSFFFFLLLLTLVWWTGSIEAWRHGHNRLLAALWHQRPAVSGRFWIVWTESRRAHRPANLQKTAYASSVLTEWADGLQVIVSTRSSKRESTAGFYMGRDDLANPSWASSHKSTNSKREINRLSRYVIQGSERKFEKLRQPFLLYVEKLHVK